MVEVMVLTKGLLPHKIVSIRGMATAVSAQNNIAIM